MFNLLALPRASWKTRATFALFTVMTIGLMVQQWSGIHDDATASRWFAWAFIVGCTLSLPRMLIVVLFGRVPKVYAGFAGSANSSPPPSDRRTGAREL